MPNKKTKKLTFIDLFAGCGGFSEGFYQEGFKSLVHVDFDNAACETIKERMRYYKYPEKSIEKSDELERKLGTLKNLLDKGLITQEDYNKKKQQLLEGF